MAIPVVHGVELKPYQVLQRPLVTEKGTHLMNKYNMYTFQVHPLATKQDIKAAVEELFKVRVEKVRTQNRVGKPRRHKLIIATTTAWKKAIVTLHEEDRISLF